MRFTRRCTSNPSASLNGQCAWAGITVRLANMSGKLFFGNGLARTRNTTNGFDPSLNLALKSLLPQRLEQHQRDAVGQVQRARLRVEHRNPQPAFAVLFQQLFRQARRLAAEHQIIIRRKFHLAVILRAVGFDEPQPRGGRKFFRERRPVLPPVPFNLLPVCLLYTSDAADE